MTSTAFQVTDTVTVVDTAPAVAESSPRLAGRTSAGILVGILAVAAVSAGAAYVARSTTSPSPVTTNPAPAAGSVSSAKTDATEPGRTTEATIDAARSRAAEQAAATSATSTLPAAKLAQVLRLSSS